MTRVRSATADDIDAVHDITRTAYLPWVPRVGLRPAPLDADYSAAVRDGRVWVAAGDGAPVGVLVLAPAGDHLLIENVAVLPSEHGTGVGSRLMVRAEEVARERGLPEIRLYTHELMTQNIAYYLRRGYVETHRTHDGGFDRVHFAKRVAPG